MSETLLNEIRATKPEAPPALRERVRALAAQEPAKAPFLARFEWRRLVLVVPAAAMVAIVAAGVIGLTRDDVVNGGGDGAVSLEAGSPSGSSGATEEARRMPPSFESAQSDALKTLAAPPAAADTAVVPPVPGQLQRYEA